MSHVEDKSLLDFVSSFKGGDGLRVEESLGEGYVRLRTSEAERRQAKHDVRCVEDAVIELLRNARDAGATRIFVGTARVGDVRTLVVTDDGVGIPPALHERVFDARVTSKLDTMHMDRWGVHGRGMALFSIRENSMSAEVMASDVGRGSSLRFCFDVSKLGERADQSTWPQVVQSAGKTVVRGPHNIYRTCVDFALEERGVCNVYVGSPSEAIATMRARMDHPSAALPVDGDEAVCVAALPAGAKDARELATVAAQLGIEMSERTAHRIIKGEIKPLVNAVAQVLATGSHGAGVQGAERVREDRARRITLSKDDETRFRQDLRRAFSALESRYYIRLDAGPTIRIGAGKIGVSFDFVEDD